MNIDYARRQMVDQQIRAWDVFDEGVLDVLRTTPRESYVPSGCRSLAFAETEIPIGHGQYMMTPTVEGRSLQALELDRAASVLEIGTGTGFLTACLAALAGSVTSIDIFEDFVDAASERLDRAGIGNVELACMDATQELPDDRYDAIAVTGSIERFDTRFVDALAPDGRLFIVVGQPPVMDARLVRRTGDGWSSESLFETCLTPLINGELPPQFEF